MSSISLRDTEKTGAKGTEDGARDPLVRLFEVALEETESGRLAGPGDRGVVRPFLLVDLGAVLSYVRGKRGGPTGTVEGRIEETLRTETHDVGRESGESGRGVLSKLVLLGAVVGLGYVLSKRSGESVDEVVSEATEQARSVADETAMRSGEAAGRTETVSEKVADRIEESGEIVAERIREGTETAAERVEEGGEQAADQIEEAGEAVEEVEEKAEESAEEMTGGDEESEE